MWILNVAFLLYAFRKYLAFRKRPHTGPRYVNFQEPFVSGSAQLNPATPDSTRTSAEPLPAAGAVTQTRVGQPSTQTKQATAANEATTSASGPRSILEQAFGRPETPASNAPEWKSTMADEPVRTRPAGEHTGEPRPDTRAVQPRPVDARAVDAPTMDPRPEPRAVERHEIEPSQMDRPAPARPPVEGQSVGTSRAGPSLSNAGIKPSPAKAGSDLRETFIPAEADSVRRAPGFPREDAQTATRRTEDDTAMVDQDIAHAGDRVPPLVTPQVGAAIAGMRASTDTDQPSSPTPGEPRRNESPRFSRLSEPGAGVRAGPPVSDDGVDISEAEGNPASMASTPEPAAPVMSDPLQNVLDKIQGQPESGRPLRELVRALYLNESAFMFSKLTELDDVDRQLAVALIRAWMNGDYDSDRWEQAFEATHEPATMMLRRS